MIFKKIVNYKFENKYIRFDMKRSLIALPLVFALSILFGHTVASGVVVSSFAILLMNQI